MLQQMIYEHHQTDESGNPAGGLTHGKGITIVWQNGPLVADGARGEPNGAFVEGVIQAAIGRLEHYQESKFACNANAMAIKDLESALKRLAARTRDREARGVEGTHKL